MVLRMNPDRGADSTLTGRGGSGGGLLDGEGVAYNSWGLIT